MTDTHSPLRAVKMEAYCVKCRLKRQIKNTHPVTMKNGKSADAGVCPSCGTLLYCIGRR